MSRFLVIDANGYTKVIGAQGPIGNQGAQGFAGPQGLQGNDGDVDDLWMPPPDNGKIADARLSANVPLLNIDDTFTGNIKFGTTQNFSWNSKTVDTVYQAASDGFAICVITAVDLTDNGYAIGYSDTSNPPTTVRVAVCNVGAKYPGTATMPVRKGDYYKFTKTVTSGTPTFTIWWVPLGTAG